MSIGPTSRGAKQARFPVQLHLPDGQHEFFDAAAEAVRQEYRNSVRWKRLRCRKVERLSDQDGVFVLEVGHSIEFDWTWEGALAFRSADPGHFNGEVDVTADFAGSANASSDSRTAMWSGEVVEVDETNGRLFVSVSNPEHAPCCGTFFVRPFEFLAFLHSLFCQPGATNFRKLLAGRLNASRGHVHPAASDAGSGLKDYAEMWGHSWAVLWGPPGCGKTTNMGRQVAACLDSDERILIVSTTNKATDAAALAVGKFALVGSSRAVEEGRILRIGKAADHEAYQANGLTGLLRGTETDLLRQIGSLSRDLEKAKTHEERALLRMQVQELRRRMKDSAFNIFASHNVKVVVATAFKAITLLNDPTVRSLCATGEAPFTTVIFDEAGLMSRAVVASMSLLAARRVVVVGDAKQLAPISRMSRVLPTSQAAWLASSCLTHLQRLEQLKPAVHFLREQHRMHPQISQVVSHYQYEGTLRNAQSVLSRKTALPALLSNHPRAVWYVLDDDGQDLPSIRAERGSGGRSWIRQATHKVLEKLFTDPEVRKVQGLFITPFRAQARDISSYLAAERLDGWSSGSVHARQGTEADVVIFDTVNAGSYAWPYDEWKRLINVGLSRARDFVLVLASRAEMSEPYLRPLLDKLAPRILKRSGRGFAWAEVPTRSVLTVDSHLTANQDLLGSQIALRKSLRPVMSKEQQRLCGLNMDGGPRLVRGVAGSGKTLVLAHWLQKTVQKLSDRPDARVWAVYANRSLHQLLEDTIEEAWTADGVVGRSPLEQAHLHHVRNLLQTLLGEVGLRISGDDFDYDAIAARYLQRVPVEKVRPRCQAMFIDEAQDMGPNTLRLLSALVEPTDPANPKGRAVNIFYDDAQNIYDRERPKWSEIGLGMTGRSSVMKESFRSTRPITEFALNVLYRLQPPDGDADHKELVKLGLIEQSTRDGSPWWDLRFNQVDGPVPIFRKFASLEDQIDALGKQVVRLVREERVKARDICILYNGKNIKWRLEQQVAPILREIGAGLAFVGDQGWNRTEDAVRVSTSHSYKGYDSEVVIIAGVEQFIASERGILANNLYVAMTRARSVLAIYSYARKKPDENTQKLLSTLQNCLDGLLARPKVELETSKLDDF
jgi:hypothetical protein